MIEKKELTEIIASNIRRLREQKGLSQADLANACKCTQPFISEVESGDALPNVVTLYRIAEVLGKTPNDIYFR